MRRSKKCKICNASMKRLRIKVGTILYGIGWVCPNYPNFEEVMHFEIDDSEGIDYYKMLIGKQKDRKRALRAQKRHWDDPRYSSKMCGRKVRRLYVREKSWMKVGWFCIGCKDVMWDKQYLHELRKRRILELRRIGVVPEENLLTVA